MTTEPRPKYRWLPGALFGGGCVLFALVACGFAYLHYALAGKPVGWVHLLGKTLTDCLFLALLALLIVWLAGRLPSGRCGWRTSLVIHAVISLVASLARAALLVPLVWVFNDEPERSRSFRELFPLIFTLQFPSTVLVYWLILGVGLALQYYRKYRERELRASQLEAQLAQAQLQVLKMQLHPHFLFNTLNAISALMQRDVELADRMLARLGDLLRSTLENAGTHEVTLQQELEFIQPYLEIEQARLGPRLTVHWEIDPETRDARVPNLLLQPLVENAIRHAVAPRPEGGRIDIRARRRGALLELCVCDDGPGLRPWADGKKGIGLDNTRARLRQLYGEDHRFDVANGPGRGLVATVAIPFQEVEGTTGKLGTEGNGAHSGPDRG